MTKISFELFGLTLLEPLSSLMNWVLAAQCLFFFYKLKRLPESDFQKYWKWFFLAYSISLVFGGFSHLLYHYLGLPGKIPGWSLAVLGVTIGETAMTIDVPDEKKRRTLRNIIRSKLFATTFLLVFNLSFTWVMIHTAGLFLFVGIIAYRRWKSGLRDYRYFLYGIGCLLLMAPVKVAGWDIHPAWFTRDDISHVLMFIAYYLFFKAVREIILKGKAHP